MRIFWHRVPSNFIHSSKESLITAHIISNNVTYMAYGYREDSQKQQKSQGMIPRQTYFGLISFYITTRNYIDLFLEFVKSPMILTLNIIQ